MASSSPRTRLASGSSDSRTAWTDWWTARSARLPIQSRRSFISFRSFSKWRSMGPFLQCPPRRKRREISRFARNDGAIQALAEAAGDVGLRARITGGGEELRRGAELDELAGEQESGKVADARGLLHVVGNGDDGAEILQLDEQLFDFGGADGVERRTGFVEKEHFGLDGKGAGDAQALLLAAGKLVGGLVEVVFYFIPEGGVPQAFFDGFGNGGFRAVDPQAIGHVVENGFGERIGALKDHADAAAIRSNVLRKDVLAIEKNFALEAGAAHDLVHAIEGAQQGGLAAAGGANERGDLIGGDAQVDVEEDLLAGKKEIDLGDGHAHGERRRRLSRRRAGHDGRYVHGQCWPHRSVHRLRPRNRNAPGKNRPGDDVNDQNQT